MSSCSLSFSMNKSRSPKRSYKKKSRSKRSYKKKSKSPKRSYKKKSRSPTRSSKSGGCSVQYTSKYSSRKSPPYPANHCCGQVMVGNDGKSWQSRPDKKGICHWYNL